MIYLIRHGLVQYPLDPETGKPLVYGSDALLSAEGRSQIERLGARLVDEGRYVDVLYTSPFPRSVETAQILCRHLNLPQAIVDNDLRDIDHTLGVGLPLEDFIAGKVKARDPLPGEVVETHEMLLDRALRATQVIIQQEEGKDIGIVSHGDLIRVLAWRLENPEGILPSIDELKKSDYLGPGEVWRVSVDSSFRLVEQEYIGRSSQEFGRGERKL